MLQPDVRRGWSVQEHSFLNRNEFWEINEIKTMYGYKTLLTYVYKKKISTYSSL